MAYPEIWPFSQVFSDYYHKSTRPLPAPVDPQNPASLQFSAIFVFNDPRDWALDSQIILDLLLSEKGILGTYSDKNGDASLPNNGWQQDNQPKLFFSNPDLFWAGKIFRPSISLPRIGNGNWHNALQVPVPIEYEFPFILNLFYRDLATTNFLNLDSCLPSPTSWTRRLSSFFRRCLECYHIQCCPIPHRHW